MRFAFYTLGCKTNQYETQAMEQLLTELGHEIGQFDQPCDGYIINTCSVTAVADKKNRAVIRRCRRDNPDAVIGVCGCYSQHAPEAVRALGVDIIGGSGGRREFVELMLSAMEGKIRAEQLDNALRRREFEVLPAGGLEERTRAMLKVQDGCVNFCSYCIIPYTRGPIRSAPVDVAVSQAQELARRGYREIVVTGIEIASWGADLPGKPEVTELIEAVCNAVPALRVRLGSLEPRIVTEDFCRRLSRLPNLCPQFHLSMQSGCDETLARMRRKYTTAEFFAVTERLRAAFPGCALTTDLITGFPGETEEEFSRTLAFIEKCAFAQMHVFPYSIRPGTKAAGMPGQIEKSEKAARAARAAHIAERMQREYLTSCVGKTLEVIFETESDGESRGHAENYTEVAVPGDMPHGVVRKVKITGVRGEMLVGTAL